MVLINDNSKILVIGDRLPAFTLPATDGSTVDSATIDAKVLAVIFTCNHCPYAKAVEERLIALGREFQGKGVRFVLICSNDAEEYPDDSFDAMKALAAARNYPFPYCQDESQDVAKSFGALCTPHCFVFDGDRRLQYKGRVDDNWKDPDAVKKRELRDAIAALVAGKVPKVQEANAMGCSIKWKT